MSASEALDGAQVSFRRVQQGRGIEPIRRELLQDETMSFRARGLLVMMLSMPDNWQFHGVRSIERLGLEGREAVRTTLRELEAHGFLARMSRRASGDHGWEWLWLWGDDPEVMAKAVNTWASSGQQVLDMPNAVVRQPVVPAEQAKHHVSPGVTGLRQPVGPVPVPPEAVVLKEVTPERTTTEEKEPPLPPAGGGSRVAQRAEAEFDAFWSAYPLRTGKQAARTAWAKALKRGANPTDVTAAAARFTEAWLDPRADRSFLPHPSTWLNQGRYEDEVPQVRVDRNQAPAISKRDRTVLGWQALKSGPPQPSTGPSRPALPGGRRELDT